MSSTITTPKIDVSHTKFTEPVKKIFDTQGAQDFQSSVTMYRLQSHLHKYTTLVGTKNIPSTSNNDAANRFTQIIDALSRTIDETPPLPGPRRFGNFACRTWHDKMRDSLDALLQDFIPEKCHVCIVEIRYYLGNAFGSKERLDYGTGHELSFLAVVSAIDMLDLWGSNPSGEDILFLFNGYYTLVKKLIATYTLEPAGSHGVWGLDDHFHLAYILGSSQLAPISHNPLRPSDILDRHTVEDYAKTNLYFQAIAFIDKVKSGSFSEHSPMLYDIAKTVSTWSKVQRGLLKMYSAEVLNKFPVVQHFWFGTGFFPWVNVKSGAILPTYETNQEENPHFSSVTSISNIPTATKSVLPATSSTTMPPPTILPSRNSPVGKFSNRDRFKR